MIIYPMNTILERIW